MIGTSFTAGLNGVRRRPGLVVLIYAMNLVLAFVLSVPIAIALSSTVGNTGFDADLARGFDFVLWADIIEEVGEALGVTEAAERELAELRMKRNPLEEQHPSRTQLGDDLRGRVEAVDRLVRGGLFGDH